MSATTPPPPPPQGQPTFGQQPPGQQPPPGHGQVPPPPGAGQQPPAGYGQVPPPYAGQQPATAYGQVPPPYAGQQPATAYGQVPPPPGAPFQGQGVPPGAPGRPARPWWKKKRFLLPIGLFILIGIINGVSSPKDDKPTPAAEPTTQEEPTVEEEPAEEEPAEEPTPTPEPLPEATIELLQVGWAAVPGAQQEEMCGYFHDDMTREVAVQGFIDGMGDQFTVDPAVVTELLTTECPAKPDYTLAQENALDKAQDYLDYSAFSKKGLIGQLEYEGFSYNDAKWAVNTLKVDWNEQAALKAADYLDYDSFSRQGLIDQLLYEGFSAAQAEYGVDQTGL